MVPLTSISIRDGILLCSMVQSFDSLGKRHIEEFLTSTLAMRSEDIVNQPLCLVRVGPVHEVYQFELTVLMLKLPVLWHVPRGGESFVRS
jgi:hypothetical protein